MIRRQYGHCCSQWWAFRFRAALSVDCHAGRHSFSGQHSRPCAERKIRPVGASITRHPPTHPPTHLPTYLPIHIPTHLSSESRTCLPHHLVLIGTGTLRGTPVTMDTAQTAAASGRSKRPLLLLLLLRLRGGLATSLTGTRRTLG